MDNHSDNRSFWQTYTFPNIWNEIKLRLAAASNRHYKKNESQTGRHAEAYEDTHARAVGSFYDEHHADFWRCMAKLFRPFEPKTLPTC